MNKEKNNLAENTGKIQRGKPFKKGESGNPSGKPKGARHKTTLAVQALLDGEAEEITRKAIEAALSGDMVAIRLCLERIAPARKDTPVSIELPEIANASDAIKTMAAIFGAVANGDITPSEGSEITKLVDSYIRTAATYELEERITLLEGAIK
jgi:hypothetical protein